MTQGRQGQHFPYTPSHTRLRAYTVDKGLVDPAVPIGNWRRFSTEHKFELHRAH